MKKYTLLYLMACIAMGACNQNGKVGAESQSDTLKTADDTSKKEKIIHKMIPVGADFTNIISVSGADIVFTQGDFCIDVVGDSSLIQYIETEIDAHVLTLSFASERNKSFSVYDGKLNVTVNISAPELNCVSVCSCGDFTSKGLWKGKDLQMGMIGDGHFHCDSIECSTFEFQASGDGDADYAHIKADKIHFANMGRSNVKADVDADFFQCDNAGHSTMAFTGKSKKKELNQTKYGKIVME